MEDHCTIDAFGPLPVVRPASAAELGEVVRQADAAGQAVYPVGGRTMLDVGLPPSRPGLAVDLRGLREVIDYPARDMTITVQAGLTVATLQALLDSEGQRLPVDVPRPERATVGGALAVNVSGPRRLGAGTLRDYVLGMTVVNDEGRETHSGGRVVKNVAGYDLAKLHVGALGTLGVITQVTLKVLPRPETQALLTFGCAADALGGLLDHLHETRTRPMCLDVLNAPAAAVVRQRPGVQLPERPWVLVVGFEDSEAAVNWQIQQLIKELTAAGVGSVEALAGASTGPLWQALTELTLPDAPLSIKAGVLPGKTAAWLGAAAALPDGLVLHAHAGSGVAHAHAPEDLTQARAAAMLKGLAAEAAAAGGDLTLPRCPPAWKPHLPVWGRPRNDAWLVRRVKEQLDPRRLFNPGRREG